MSKQTTIEQIRATEKVNRLINTGEPKKDISERIGINRKTLLVRLRESNWKKAEVLIIKSL